MASNTTKLGEIRKEEIKKFLNNHPGEFFSVNQIAKIFKISRSSASYHLWTILRDKNYGLKMRDTPPTPKGYYERVYGKL